MEMDMCIACAATAAALALIAVLHSRHRWTRHLILPALLLLLLAWAMSPMP